VVCYPLRDSGDEIGSGCKKRQTPPMKRGLRCDCRSTDDQQDDLRGSAGPLLIAGEPVGLARYALHFRVRLEVLSTFK
jgi:hypothetical protein